MSPSGALESLRVRLPVRLKLAVVSAALTFVILLLFAVVVGTVAERRVSGSFDNELRATAADLQQIVQRQGGSTSHALGVLRAAAAGGAQIRILDRSGNVIAPGGSSPLAPPGEGVQDVGGYHVATRPIFGAELPETSPFSPGVGQQNAVDGYLEYARPERNLSTTIARVRLFLTFGVLGGTALAFLAGFLVARRAMRPIAGLTHAAREVARTRDPDVALPKPVAQDEVAELADTLEDMLRELGEARTESESALARQREFVADASHELRTPLTSILANLELLEGELDGEQQEIAGSALRSSRRMRRLVADLLLLARADAGREAPRRPVDLAGVAREAVAETAPLGGGEERIAVDAPTGVIVEAVRDDLHRLALNLIENALVHTPQGTPVTVAVREEEGTAVLEVSDRGPGVPNELRQRVFDRFTRGAGSGDVTPARSGSGLGLAIVRAVAEGHGGSVEVSDAEGGGAKFLVRLPLGAGPEKKGPVPFVTPPPPREAPSDAV
ncbi:MAG TPA: HAMP domain-containing sensor histidine kinase [Thermoleophilaceae bacterium]